MKLPELSDDEYCTLLLMCGYATGSAWNQNRRLARSFIRLTNRLNELNPEFKPYQIGDEEEDSSAGS